MKKDKEIVIEAQKPPKPSKKSCYDFQQDDPYLKNTNFHSFVKIYFIFYYIKLKIYMYIN